MLVALVVVSSFVMRPTVMRTTRLSMKEPLRELNDTAPPEITDADWALLEESLRAYYRDQEALRKRPSFLSYSDAASWARRMALWSSKQEWDDWIASGEKSTPYIPSNPEAYYGDAFQGWHHFLFGDDDDSS